MRWRSCCDLSGPNHSSSIGPGHYQRLSQSCNVLRTGASVSAEVYLYGPNGLTTGRLARLCPGVSAKFTGKAGRSSRSEGAMPCLYFIAIQ